MSRIAAGDFDIVVLSPRCCTWSRARWNQGPGPAPVRNRQHPWGIPHLKYEWTKRHAREGNEFILFSIRSIVTCQECKRRGSRCATILEHPEDLGRVPSGQPSSIWQLPELRRAYAEFDFVTVARPQCQFGLDAPKPTRLLSDLSPWRRVIFRFGRGSIQRIAIWGRCRGIAATATSSRPAVSFRGEVTRRVLWRPTPTACASSSIGTLSRTGSGTARERRARPSERVVPPRGSGQRLQHRLSLRRLPHLSGARSPRASPQRKNRQL